MLRNQPWKTENMFAWKHSILLAIQKPLSISSIKLISTSLCQSTVQSNYYDVLDVPRTATQKEIREAYINKSREVSAKYHHINRNPYEISDCKDDL